jgi:hypothetical protein
MSLASNESLLLSTIISVQNGDVKNPVNRLHDITRYIHAQGIMLTGQYVI